MRNIMICQVFWWYLTWYRMIYIKFTVGYIYVYTLILSALCYILFIQFAMQGEGTFFHFLSSRCTIVSIVFTYSVTGITWHINRNTCNKSLRFTTCSTSIYFMICPKFCSSIIISNSPMRHVLSIDAASPVSWALLDAFCLPQSFDQNSFSAAFRYAPVPHTQRLARHQKFPKLGALWKMRLDSPWKPSTCNI